MTCGLPIRDDFSTVLNHTVSDPIVVPARSRGTVRLDRQTFVLAVSLATEGLSQFR